MNTHVSSSSPSSNVGTSAVTATATTTATVTTNATAKVPTTQASHIDPMPGLLWMLSAKMLTPVHSEPQKAGVEIFDWSPALWEQVEIKAGQRKVKPVVRPTRGQLAAATAAEVAASANQRHVGEFGL